jgi:rhodanese-related sulfurtransferase
MARFLDFLVTHWILSGLWLAIATLLLAYLNSKTAKSVSPQAAAILVNKADGAFLDIRERKDFEKGHIVDAINIPLAKLQERITELEKNKETPLIVVCQMGHHSGEAVKILQAKGFTTVFKMFGGMAEWNAQNLPVVK